MPAYLKYGSLRGPAQGKYKGWFPLESVKFGNSSQYHHFGTGHGGAQSPIRQIIVSRKPDDASTRVQEEMVKGSPAVGVVEVTRVDGRSKLETVNYRAKFTGAVIGSYWVLGEPATEEWSLDCEAVEFEVTAEPGGN